jgi:tetratricopeptide (TPR) repeat protein
MKKNLLLLLAFATSFVTIATAQQHPAYLHALSDLRAARWMIQHRPGNWNTTVDEMAASQKIDDAINEIKKASIDDGKDINDHPKAQEINEHAGRLVKAIEYLRKARADIAKDEDNVFAQGLQKRAYYHIDEAIRITEKARLGIR